MVIGSGAIGVVIAVFATVFALLSGFGGLAAIGIGVFVGAVATAALVFVRLICALREVREHDSQED